MVFFPNEIMMIITDFMGRDYWIHRSELTKVSQAVDFMYSDYAINSWWLWRKWRSKHDHNLKLCPPNLPERFRDMDSPYIESKYPPESCKHSKGELICLHSFLRKKVYFQEGPSQADLLGLDVVLVIPRPS